MADAPRMLVGEEDAGTEPIHELYGEIINDRDIIEQSRDLFVSGFYSHAVEEAFKYVDNFVKRNAKSKLSGNKLMELVFSPNDPIF